MKNEIYVSVKNSEKYVSKQSQINAWDANKLYQVLSFESYSETGAGFVILCNDIGEIWWINNQDVLVKNCGTLSILLNEDNNKNVIVG